MNKNFIYLFMSLILSGCASFVASQYGTKVEIDQFNNNQKKVMMTGGVIDADFLGIVANAAEFNPFVVRSQENKILLTGIRFTFENNTTITQADWLNIRNGSTITFVFNNGSRQIIQAQHGSVDISYYTDDLLGIDYTTKHDQGIFMVSPRELKQIANSSIIAVRVSGKSSSIDFPRKPNNHLIDNFQLNFKMFYASEIKPYLNKN